MQLLWINLVTDSLPAIALGMEPVEKDVMDRNPKPKKEGLFAHGFGIRIILQGFMFGILSLVAFKIGCDLTGDVGYTGLFNIDHTGEVGGRTLAFMTLAISQVLQSFNMRSEHSIFKIGVFSNHKLNWAVLASLVLVLFVLFTPGVNTIFGLTILPLPAYLIGLGLVFIPTIIMEISKAIGLIKHHK